MMFSKQLQVPKVRKKKLPFEKNRKNAVDT